MSKLDFSSHVDQFVLCLPTRLTVISKAASLAVGKI